MLSANYCLWCSLVCKSKFSNARASVELWWNLLQAVWITQVQNNRVKIQEVWLCYLHINLTCFCCVRPKKKSHAAELNKFPWAVKPVNGRAVVVSPIIIFAIWTSDLPSDKRYKLFSSVQSAEKKFSDLSTKTKLTYRNVFPMSKTWKKMPMPLKFSLLLGKKN